MHVTVKVSELLRLLFTAPRAVNSNLLRMRKNEEKTMKKIETVRIGTRGSKLALAQTELVIAAWRKKYPRIALEPVIIRTKGDKILDRPLLDFGGKGVFVTEFEEALYDGRIDLAVHSAKDMPMKLGDNLVIAGTLPREDARDVLVSREGRNPVELENPVIGTGSARRQFQLKKLYPHAKVVGIRGNVTTRLQKLQDRDCDGVVLAMAGLKRLGILDEKDYDFRIFSNDEMIPAGGQGIIAVEGRCGDEISDMVRQISDEAAFMELEAERRVLEVLEAGCHAAIGVAAQVKEQEIRLWIRTEWKGQTLERDETAACSERILLAERLALDIKAIVAASD